MGTNKSQLLFVEDNNQNNENKSPGFNKKLFPRKYDFEILKDFCKRYALTQQDLVLVYSSYLSNEEAFLRDFRISLIDVKKKFLRHSKLIQVIYLTDLYYKLLLLK